MGDEMNREARTGIGPQLDPPSLEGKVGVPPLEIKVPPRPLTKPEKIRLFCAAVPVALSTVALLFLLNAPDKARAVEVAPQPVPEPPSKPTLVLESGGEGGADGEPPDGADTLRASLFHPGTPSPTKIVAQLQQEVAKIKATPEPVKPVAAIGVEKKPQSVAERLSSIRDSIRRLAGGDRSSNKLEIPPGELGAVSRIVPPEVSQETYPASPLKEELGRNLVHIIQKGENLREIAQRYNMTIDALVKANDIKNPDLIHPGEALRIIGSEFGEQSIASPATERTIDANQIKKEQTVVVPAKITIFGDQKLKESFGWRDYPRPAEVIEVGDESILVDFSENELAWVGAKEAAVDIKTFREKVPADFENNFVLQRILKELTPAAETLNKVFRDYLDPADFKNGEIPQIPTDLTHVFEFKIYNPPADLKDNWFYMGFVFGGGGGRLPKDGGPILYGNYHLLFPDTDPEVLDRAWTTLASNAMHEALNSFVRPMSQHDPVGEEFRRAEWKGINPYSSREWLLMYWLGTYLENMGTEAVGIHIDPDPIIVKVIDRLREAGVPDLEKKIVNAAVHGDGPLEEIRQLYELNRLADEPSIEEMFLFGLESEEMREKYSPLLERYSADTLGEIVPSGTSYFFRRREEGYLTTTNFVFFMSPDDIYRNFRSQKPLYKSGPDRVYPDPLGVVALRQEWARGGREMDYGNLPKMSSSDLPPDFRTVYSLVGADLLGKPLECREERCYFMNGVLEKNPEGVIDFMPLGEMDARGDFADLPFLGEKFKANQQVWFQTKEGWQCGCFSGRNEEGQILVVLSHPDVDLTWEEWVEKTSSGQIYPVTFKRKGELTIPGDLVVDFMGKRVRVETDDGSSQEAQVIGSTQFFDPRIFVKVLETGQELLVHPDDVQLIQ